jgi:hypothetical protein
LIARVHRDRAVIGTIGFAIGLDAGFVRLAAAIVMVVF